MPKADILRCGKKAAIQSPRRRSEFRAILVLLLLTVLGGTIFYATEEGWDWIDAAIRERHYAGHAERSQICSSFHARKNWVAAAATFAASRRVTCVLMDASAMLGSCSMWSQEPI